MAKKHLTRKQLLKEPDEFFTLTGKAIEWCRQYPKQIGYSVAVFFGIVVFVSAFSWFSERREQAAYTLLSQVLATYETALKEKDPIQASTAVQQDFKQLLDQYDGQTAGQLGHIIFGHIQIMAEATQDAADLYQKAWDDFSNDPALANIILNGLGCAFAQKGDETTAIGYFEQIANGTNAMFKDTALFHLGRLYEKTGQTEKSRQVYQQLSGDFPNSIYANIAREKLAG